MASAVARAYNGGLGAEPPAGSRGRALVKGSGGRSPLKLKHFFGFWTFNESRKFAHFSKILKRKEIRYLRYVCKNHWWSRNWG